MLYYVYVCVFYSGFSPTLPSANERKQFLALPCDLLLNICFWGARSVCLAYYIKRGECKCILEHNNIQCHCPNSVLTMCSYCAPLTSTALFSHLLRYIHTICPFLLLSPNWAQVDTKQRDFLKCLKILYSLVHFLAGGTKISPHVDY